MLAALVALAPDDFPVVGAVSNPAVFWTLFVVFGSVAVYGGVQGFKTRPGAAGVDDQRAPLPPPAPLPRPLFSLLIADHPANGVLDGDRMVYFPNALLTELLGTGRAIRFALTMPEREFLDFNRFQALYRDFDEPVREKYMSNPADTGLNRHGHIAFVHKKGTPTGVTEGWTLHLRDPKLPHAYEIDALGEWECMDDGTIRSAI